MIAVAPPVKEPVVSGAELARRQAALVDRVEKTRREHRRFLRIRAGIRLVLALLLAA